MSHPGASPVHLSSSTSLGPHDDRTTDPQELTDADLRELAFEHRGRYLGPNVTIPTSDHGLTASPLHHSPVDHEHPNSLTDPLRDGGVGSSSDVSLRSRLGSGVTHPGGGEGDGTGNDLADDSSSSHNGKDKDRRFGRRRGNATKDVDGEGDEDGSDETGGRGGGGGGTGAATTQSSRNDILQSRRSGTHLLLYTRAVPLPKRFETVTEYRFLMRMTQLFMAAAAFASLATASFNVDYTSSVLAVSGINLMSFTSITSIFVSFGCILVYCFPAFTGVPPHRHPRFSRVEVMVDLVYLGFWTAAASVLVWYGSQVRCPRFSFAPNPEAVSCLPWNMCTAFGFASAALFLGTLVMGVRDLARYGLFSTGRGNGVMWARGSWKEWAES
ncbi:hypothetical protein HKX48_006165 [Thoreauomyces humboldtii]|nr:hypothetical protein HKX48_006165 [Thoreauomyces humboldtii]